MENLMREAYSLLCKILNVNDAISISISITQLRKYASWRILLIMRENYTSRQLWRNGSLWWRRHCERHFNKQQNYTKRQL